MTADAKEYTAGIDIETNHDEGAGALGCFARDKNGKTVLLSCSHVLFPAFNVIDDLRVFQPNYSSCCSSGDPIARPVFDAKKKAEEIVKGVEWSGGYHEGKWFGGFNSIPAKIGSNFMGATDPSGHASEVDCAIAMLDPGIKFRNVWRFEVGDQVQEVPLVGAVTDGLGVGKGPDLGTAPTSAQYVRVYSTSAGKLMFGTLLSTPPADIPHVDDPDKIIYRWGISDSSDAGMGIKTSVNQFLILPRPTPVEGQSYEDSYRNGQRLSFDHGDSGSVVINHQNRIIGMIIRKYDLDKIMAVDRSFMEFADIGSIAIATPIQKILEHLEITIPDAATGFAGTASNEGTVTRVFVSGFAADPEAVALRRRVEHLRHRLLASRRGRFLLGRDRAASPRGQAPAGLGPRDQRGLARFGWRGLLQPLRAKRARWESRHSHEHQRRVP